MRIESRKLALIIISLICIVIVVFHRKKVHLVPPSQQHTSSTHKAAIDKLIKRLQQAPSDSESIEPKSYVNKKEPKKIFEPLIIAGHHDILQQEEIDSTVMKEESVEYGVQSPQFIQTDSINYKDGFIGENLCCKSLSGSEIGPSCLKNGDLFKKLKLKTTVHQVESLECSCIDYFTCRLVVVSGFSSNHFKEAQDMIASVQHNLPHTKLIVYDLGLSTSEIQSVQSYCNVEYRTFNFTNYPSHARNLRTYAFKPLIVNEVSQEYEIMMWADASVRVMGPIVSTLFPHLSAFPFQSGPLYSKIIPIVSTTHDRMLDYLNITQTRQELKDFNTLQACNWIMWMNKVTREKLLKYWVNCALRQECIAPKGSRRSPCKFKDGTFNGDYWNCHRYDQSALNFILIREFGLDIWDLVYHKEVETVLKIERAVTNHFTPAAADPCQAKVK